MRDREGDVFKFHIHLFWYDDLFGIALESLSQFDDTQLQQFFVTLVQFLLVFNRETLVDTAVGYVDIVDKCEFLVVIEKTSTLLMV